MRLSWMSCCGSFALIALCCATSPRPAQGADAQGQFAIKGVGVGTCQQYVETRAARSQLYARFDDWLAGFLTATNRYEPNTYDTAPWGTPEILATIIDNHCQNNPQDRFVEAIQKLLITLKADRIESSSPVVTVIVEGRSVRLYEEMLRRVQTQLVELGLYNGAPDGIFGAKTEEAIATFQISEGLDGTGIPDPLTVWKLVNP